MTREAGRATVAVFALRELGSEFPANRPHLFKWFGPYEVNLSYYPSWEGQDRPLLLPMAKAVTLPLVLSLSHPGPLYPARLGELRGGAAVRARDAGFSRAFSGSLHLPPEPATGPQRGKTP